MKSVLYARVTLLLMFAGACRSDHPYEDFVPPFVPITVRLPNGRAIGGEMRDAEILNAFQAPNAVKKEFVQGKDGTSTTYTGDGETVMISRSMVTGVYVSASGRISGDWRLSRER